MSEDDAIIKEFLVESYENLDRLDQDLVVLEKDPANRDTLASIFRTIHTIKGTSGFLSYNRLGALTHVGEIPAIVQPLSAMLNLPVEQVDVEQIVRLVSYHSSIAAQCLRMANSPLFGRRTVETVRSAILALGLKRVQSILLGCCLNRIVPADKWSFNATSFWRHSMGCALVSRKLATSIGYPEPEKAYLAGLLHDLGMLVNTLACTEEYRQCFVTASKQRSSLESAERALLGFTHCESGRLLAERWKFSDDIIAVIGFHHHIADAPCAPALVDLVHLSDLLCRLRDLGRGFMKQWGSILAKIRLG